jgi:hypothetical protein
MRKELTKLFVPKEENNSKNIGVFDRESFRSIEPFRTIYETDGADIQKYYKTLQEVYDKLEEIVKMEPRPKRVEEFDREITDSDLLSMEADTGILYLMTLNFGAAMLDISAGRPFIPRDPTTDGSYETAERMKREKENQ